ncbi:DNA polymerase III subunit beta [Nonomuraea sp. PA05]|uniref:DNA polymerase III subunit beta n=1 Tax=Nonomuraea sp. PA05 TaxID=2604466 RepID=UPI0011D41A08|nr:DNA polymerase III subunit beta [Nonomuraea sp. PA05]TYB50261.1 DNA polymerase III subunit beta [Nonomuraea sp. PA05]
MKFTIMAGELADAVGYAAHALPKRPSVPVLAGILLEAGQVGEWEGIQVSAFDYDTSRQAEIEVDAAIDPGKVLVPGRLLADIVKVFPKGELVDVAADDREVTIRCGKAEYVIPLMPVEDFPSLPSAPAAIGSVDTSKFAAAVAQAASAAGKDETLPQLTGLRFEVGDGLVDLAATDRYRMTWRTLEWTATVDAPAELTAVIPARAVHDVARGLPGGTSVEVGLAADKGLVAFTCGGRRTTVRLLDNEFPPFRSHFDKQAEAKTRITATFDAAALAKVVKRVSLVARSATPVRLAFTADGVLVEAGGGEDGRGTEQADCQLDGDPITIAFDPARLAPALATFTGPVELHMTTSVRPAVLQHAGDTTYRHLIMPIRQDA